MAGIVISSVMLGEEDCLWGQAELENFSKGVSIHLPVVDFWNLAVLHEQETTACILTVLWMLTTCNYTRKSRKTSDAPQVNELATQGAVE